MSKSEVIQQRILADLNKIGERHERDENGNLPMSFWNEVTIYYFKKYMFIGWPLWLSIFVLGVYTAISHPSFLTAICFGAVIVKVVKSYFSAKSAARSLKKNGERMKREGML